MSDIAIHFENIGKLYHLGTVGTGTLGDDLNRWWQTKILGKEDPYLKVGEINDRAHKGTSNFVWALRDINFDVREGEVVGIIGKNGAGKSTLLKLLSRVTSPTTGVIYAKGRIASLLEVGTGFHGELTGRENIYMNGSILGMTKAEINRKLDEIVDFAGVERYIDTPVKRYSSGMTVRLGFAVAAFLEPEILVVDEVLAVGDAEFQKKAIGKMQDISHGEGRTVLFVSHNMAASRRLCTRGVLLDNGCVSYDGTTYDVIAEYLKDEIIQTSFEGIDGDPNLMYLSSAKVYSDDPSGIIFNESKIIIDFTVTLNVRIASFVCGFNIFSAFQHPLARADFNDRNQLKTLEPGTYRFIYEIPPCTLAIGSYKVFFDVAELNVVRHTTEKSQLVFTVQQKANGFGNVYAENTQKKSSIFCEDWLREYHKL